MFIQTIKAFYTQNRRDPFIFWPVCIVVTAAIIMCMLVGFLYTKLPPQIPLYYSLPWGDEQLTHPSVLFLLLGGGLGGFCINVGIGMSLKKISPLFTHILAVGSTLLYLLLVFSVVKIVFLVT